MLDLLGGYVVPRGRENAPRWDGRRRGRYEVWYLTFNVPGSRRAYWLRYTLDAPDAGPVHSELWGHAFDGGAPERAFGLRRRVGPDGLALGGSQLVRIGEAELGEGRARGALEGHGHSLSWDLSFEPSAAAVFIAPRWLRPVLERRATNWCVPNGDVRFRGEVVADGERIAFSGAPGQQAHLYGRRHAERWAWLHCNAFDGDRRAVVEGVAATVRLGGAAKTVTAIYVRHGGRDYVAQALPRALWATSEAAFPSFRFRAAANGVTIEGHARAAPDRMLQVAYEDPDGTPSYCANSEVGDLTIELRRGNGVELLTATGTAHVEFGGRERRPDIPLCPGP